MGERKTSDGVGVSTIAIPITVRGAIEVMICLEGGPSETEPFNMKTGLFEVVASTVGNAMRNVRGDEASGADGFYNRAAKSPLFSIRAVTGNELGSTTQL